MDESRRGVSLASASLRNPQAPVVASVRATPRTPPSSTHLFLFLSPPGFSPASHAVQETDGRTKPPHVAHESQKQACPCKQDAETSTIEIRA